jgi:predicted SAM-dependent methyltransferase
MAEGPKIHLGSWRNAPESWINVDGSWNAWLSKRPQLRRAAGALGVLPEWAAEGDWPASVVVHDLRKGLPFPDGFAGAIYGSHLIEHLYLEEAERLLAECHRVLQAGGVLRLVVPDLGAIVREYLGERPFADSEAKATAPRADRVNERLMLRDRRPPAGNPAYRVYTAIKDFHSHKWMYDAESLAARLGAAGFVDVREMAYLESRIEAIDEVEIRKRVVDECGICIEGVKP